MTLRLDGKLDVTKQGNPWPDGLWQTWQGQYVVFLTGHNAGRVRQIVSSTATTVVVADGLPDQNTEFVIIADTWENVSGTFQDK
jgi:hypothetical protein